MSRRSWLLLLAVFAGCAKSQPADPIPAHDELRIESQVMGETRVINVWTPPGSADSREPLPVLYMPDGGIGEDFPHIAGTLAELVAAGRIAPLILVGIENTQRRRDLTGPSTVEEDGRIAPLTDGSSVFREFIATELMPRIEASYRTDGRRAIVGESAAGLFIVETFFLRPELFDLYIAMDPALYWNDHALVKQAAARLGCDDGATAAAVVRRQRRDRYLSRQRPAGRDPVRARAREPDLAIPARRGRTAQHDLPGDQGAGLRVGALAMTPGTRFVDGGLRVAQDSPSPRVRSRTGETR